MFSCIYFSFHIDLMMGHVYSRQRMMDMVLNCHLYLQKKENITKSFLVFYYNVSITNKDGNFIVIYLIIVIS